MRVSTHVEPAVPHDTPNACRCSPQCLPQRPRALAEKRSQGVTSLGPAFWRCGHSAANFARLMIG